MTQKNSSNAIPADFVETIRAGRRTIAWAMIEEALSQGTPYTHIQTEIILPALQAIASGDDEAHSAKAQAALGFVIEKLTTNAPRKFSRTPVALIAGNADDERLKNLEAIIGGQLCDMLAGNGWRAEYVASGLKPDEVAGRAAALRAEALVMLGLDQGAATKAEETLESMYVSEMNCRAILCGPGFADMLHEYPEGDALILPEIRSAYLLLSAAGFVPDDDIEPEKPFDYLENMLEDSDVLFCTLDNDLIIRSANQRCRDGFGMCQGECILQHLEEESASVMEKIAGNESLPVETVEITFMKHGEPYLADTLLMPRGDRIAVLAHSRQEEIDKLTTILTNYNKEINSLNCNLHNAETKIEAQSVAIEEAHRELSQAYKTLRELEWNDPLTGVYNRHYYDLALVKEVNRAKRYNRDLSFLAIDVDDFKKINEEYGHPVGDAVLCHVVRAITACTRGDIDWMARLGNDEFVLVMPETDMQGCMTVGTKLLRQIAEEPVIYKDGLINVTISAGGAAFDPTESFHLSYQELPRIADKALINAQKKGPNTVEVTRID